MTIYILKVQVQLLYSNVQLPGTTVTETVGIAKQALTWAEGL